MQVLKEKMVTLDFRFLELALCPSAITSSIIVSTSSDGNSITAKVASSVLLRNFSGIFQVYSEEAKCKAER
jgi:hypothetical protein